MLAAQGGWRRERQAPGRGAHLYMPPGMVSRLGGMVMWLSPLCSMLWGTPAGGRAPKRSGGVSCPLTRMQLPVAGGSGRTLPRDMGAEGGGGGRLLGVPGCGRASPRLVLGLRSPGSVVSWDCSPESRLSTGDSMRRTAPMWVCRGGEGQLLRVRWLRRPRVMPCWSVQAGVCRMNALPCAMRWGQSAAAGAMLPARPPSAPAASGAWAPA